MAKKSASKAVAAAPVVGKSVEIVKRESEAVLEKASVKKHKKDESVQQAAKEDEKSKATTPPAPAAANSVKASESSSSDDSSNSEEDVKAAAPTAAVPEAVSEKTQDSDDSSSDDESGEDEESSEDTTTKLESVSEKTQDSDDSSSDDESGEDEESSEDTTTKLESVDNKVAQESSDESSDEEPSKTPEKTDADVDMVDAESEKKVPRTPSTSQNTKGSTTLFAGNLSFQIEEANLREFFKFAGEIVDVRFGVDHEGMFKGYGHIEFESEAAAHKALQLNEEELLGRPIRLELANAKRAFAPSSGTETTLFVKGFDASLGEDEVRGALTAHFGLCGTITNVSLPADREGSLKGIAYIDFTEKSALQKALELDQSELNGSSLTVDVAKPREPRLGTETDPKSTLFVKGFDASLGEDEVRRALTAHFGLCGTITNVSLPADREGSLKGIAYIDFTEKSALQKALELDQSELNGSSLTVDAAKPREPRGRFQSAGRFSGGGRGGRRGRGRGGYQQA